MGFLGLTSDQFWLVLLGCGLVVLLWQVNALREARKPLLKPKILKQLRWGEPITVKHDTPRSLTPDGKELWGVQKRDFDLFQSFWYFADWINKLYGDLSEPIRLQELKDTEIKGSLSSERPAYGRRYDIFYNQCKIGLLQICASPRSHLNPNDKTVDVEITIDGVPPTVLPYSNVYGFLQTIASLVASMERPKFEHLPDGDTEYEHAMSDIRAAIIEFMWNMHGDNWWPELKVELSGTPDHYYHLLQLRLEEDGSKAAAGARGV